MGLIFRKIFSQQEARKPLIASMLLMAATGIIYIWSVFIIPLEQDFGWPRNQISLVFTVTMVCLSAGLALGGFVHKKIPVKRLLAIATVLVAISFAVTSFSRSLTVMVVFYGALCGSVMGIVYSLIIYTCNLWFSKDIAATVSGLLQSCLAISTIFLSYMAAGMLEVYDWRTVLRVIGVGFVVVLLFAYKYLSQPSLSCGQDAGGEASVPESGLDWHGMIKTRSFWLFWFIRLATLSGGVGMIGHAVPIALELGVSYKSAIFALGLLSLCNGAGRTVFGIIWDYAGLKKTILLDIVFFISAFALLFTAPLHKSPYLVLAAFGLSGLSYGGANLMGISFTRTVFGLKHFAENYGFNSSSMIVSSFFGPYLLGEIKLFSGSYHNAFLVFMAFGCLSTVFLLLIKKTSY